MSRNTTSFLLIGAVLLGLVTVVGLLTISNRNRTATPTAEPISTEGGILLEEHTFTVGGVSVTTFTEQGQQVDLIPEAVPDISPIVEQPVEQPVVEPPPVEQPVEQLPDPTPIPPADIPPPPAVTTTGRANFAVNEIIFINYIVVAQDTLYRLTEKHNTSIELMAQNGISSDSFVVGNTLRLPIANPDRCPGLRPYVVREKDTVFRIANAYATTPPIIRDINGLNAEYRINVTQVLCLP